MNLNANYSYTLIQLSRPQMILYLNGTKLSSKIKVALKPFQQREEKKREEKPIEKRIVVIKIRKQRHYNDGDGICAPTTHTHNTF